MDYKNHQAPEQVNVLRQTTWFVIWAVLAAIAYVSESDYQTCMDGVKSIYLCGGGNNR